MDANGIIDNVDDLAGHFGKSSRTIRRWIVSGMPMLPDGRFDILQVTAWRRSKKGSAVSNDYLGEGDTQQGKQEVSPGIGDKDYWDMVSKKEQALKRQLDRREREEELMERKAHEDVSIIRIIEVKALLLAFERVLPPELIHCRTDREMSEVIRKFTHRILKRFSRPFAEFDKARDKDAPTRD